MNLSDLASMVCTKIGKTDDDSIAACKTYLQARHEMIVDSYPWKDTLGVFEVQVAAESRIVVLPSEAARPWAVWDADEGIEIPVASLTSIVQTNPSALEDIGGTRRFIEMDSVGVPWDLDANGEQIGVSAALTSEDDVGVSIGITGIAPLSDPIPVNRSKSITRSMGLFDGLFSTVCRITKPITADSVTVYRASAVGAPVFYIPANATESVFARIRLVQPPIEAMTLGVLAKRRIRQMALDSDGPMIRGIDNALLAFAQGDMLERSRQYAKAAAKIQEGTALLEGARDLERNQSARESRIIPVCVAEEGDQWHQW